MKGDGIIKIIFKFIGTGLCNNYQANIKIYSDNKLIVNSKTYNGEICLILAPNKIYRLNAKFLNEEINASFYTNINYYIFKFNHSIISSRTINLSLKDYYYNIPIEKGEMILWQK